MADRIPNLSKSRYQKGLQCRRQLWLECYRKELADPIPTDRQALFDTGHRVGALARLRFPGGSLIDAGYRAGASALRQTARLMKEGHSVLFEAAFDGDGVFVRADVVRRASDGRWDLIEAKQSGEVKEEHITDAAVQLHSMERAGLSVGSVFILHIDKQYVWDGGRYDPLALFALVDVTERARAHLAVVPTHLAEMREMLQGPCPEMRFGKHCRHPYDCSFLGHCRAGLPVFPITDLPWVTDEQLAAFQADGILSVAEIPATYPGLQPRQRTVCRVAAEQRVEYDPELRRALSAIDQPLYFLDFETVMPALPLFPQTRPYQQIPVQWSLHRLDGGGLEHFEYLHEGRADPRTAVVETLLEEVGERGTVVVYSSFENTRLTKLAEELPRYADELVRLQARLFDLEKVVRDHVCHHAFHGRTSLKKVLPATVPDLSYSDLVVQDGRMAMSRYEAAIREQPASQETDQLFSDLRAYCARDTLGLCRVYQHLVVQAFA